MNPTDSISYNDVAAQTSTFFRGLAGDKVIDPAEKSRLATSFFSDVSQIRKIRDQNAMVPLRMERERLALDEARFSMDRARKAAEQEDSFTALNAEVDGTLQGIMDDDVLTPEEKVQEIRRAEFEAQRRVPPSMSGGSSWLSRKFGTAIKATSPNTSDLTPAQTIGLFQAGVPQEIIESGDPILIGRAAADASQRAQMAKAQLEMQEDVDKEARSKAAAYESALLGISNIDYAIDPNKPDPTTGEPSIDKTRLKGGDVAVARLKRVLSQSPDPEIRKAAATDDVGKLREAYMKAMSPGASSPSIVLPARP